MRREDIRTGDVYLISSAASVQFAGDRALLFRVIRVDPRVTYDGWVWLDGYSLDVLGHAVERRTIFVQTNGLRRPVGQALNPGARTPKRNTRSAGEGNNAGPAAGSAGAVEVATRTRAKR